ncbi:nitrate- and nitrite sensing domain-containing protein [Micromonospora sp. WMMD812]|uniref:sensor histidine kinase n=1 Tax=Micromonospora sp. WMMD812 TaxID=3015152 RepID=UPI00248C13EC|nr:nitrate- and nitrite sensing domain-containing protein [Micromonospora sp. WMMD812]WBB65153.1 nitrate- and nitrite sensing domain-containing protein [Micromonospora sp. WMMD812]
MSGHGAASTGQHLRRQFVATAVVLVALWSYAAYLTGRDAADLLRIRALAETLGQPTDRLILDLQTERRLTAGTIANTPRARAALAGARDGTDRTVTTLRDTAAGTDLRLLTAGAVRDRADQLLRHLDGLPGLRAEADAGRAEAVAGYDRLIDTAFAVYGPEWGARETNLAAETRAVVALARSRELLAREDTLLTTALTNGRITADDRRRLTELISNQRYAGAEAVTGLPAADQAAYRTLLEGPRFAELLSLEDQLLRPGDDRPAFGVDSWRPAADSALAGLHELVRSTARRSVERATPGAALVVTRTGAVLGLGLIAVLALLVAGTGTVRRLSAGTRAPSQNPPIADGTTASGPLPAATAAPPQLPVHTEPAAPPAGTGHVPAGNQPGPGPATRDLFLRVTQRNQALLREQFTLLDAMERREHNAEDTADLFQLDHLATRLRRNVEKLVTLAGARPARRWRRPVPLLDVVRGAVAEVADYQRVLVAPQWPWSLAGPAVTDVTHLLAELVENALAYSPASTTVRLGGEERPTGCAVEVTDDGPGLDPATLAEANRLLADPPPTGPPNGRTGLYAAALLAARCGARVSLHPGPRGGTAAVVLLPPTLVTQTGPDGAATGPGGPRPGPAVGTTSGSGVAGDLPVRTRQPGSVRPGPGTAGSDTVEIPVSRAARGHR